MDLESGVDASNISVGPGVRCKLFLVGSSDMVVGARLVVGAALVVGLGVI